MLEVFKDLFVSGDPAKLDAFIDDITIHLGSGWSRDHEGEKRINEMVSSDSERQYAFAREADSSLPAAGLALMRRGDRLEVTNIVPRAIGSLTKAQYNAILDTFEQIARPVAARLGLNIELTPAHLPISHWLSGEATRRLKSFSGAANKGSGSSHPADFRRWAAFLIQCHRERAKIDGGTLQRWLIEEEGWPEEIAIRLASEFEFSRDLFEAYDAER